MENLRLGVSAVRHDMKQEETVEEVEKNTELERQTPKVALQLSTEEKSWPSKSKYCIDVSVAQQDRAFAS